MAARKKVRRKKTARARKAKAGRRKQRAPRAAKTAKKTASRASRPATRRTSRPAPRVRARPTRRDPTAARNARGSARETSEVATLAAAIGAPPAPLPPAPPRAHAAALAVLASAPVRVGSVRHYFPRSRAARIAVDGALETGERLHVRGATSDFLMEVSGLRANGRSVDRVAGGEATLAVPSRVRPGDALFALRPGA
jgi:hypothetical protein